MDSGTSIFETAESLPPGYDSKKTPEPLKNEETVRIAFEEYLAPKQKKVIGDSFPSCATTLNTILPSALVMDFNPIMNLTLSQRQCDDLCSISLNDCGLQDLPAFVPTWDSLTSLHTISLDNNLFKTPPSYGLAQLGPSLTQLSLSGCRLEAFPDALVLKLPFLRHLNVESNSISEMPNTMSHLTCLTNLRMSENLFSNIDFEVFKNMALNELTIFQQKHIHSKDASLFTVVEGIASRRGSINIAWNRIFVWSAAKLDDLQPWIAKHLELKLMPPLTTPVAFQSEEITYSFKDGSNWELLRKDWQRQVRMHMLPL
jgi:hypothetical protein